MSELLNHSKELEVFESPPVEQRDDEAQDNLNYEVARFYGINI